MDTKVFKITRQRAESKSANIGTHRPLRSFVTIWLKTGENVECPVIWRTTEWTVELADENGQLTTELTVRHLTSTAGHPVLINIPRSTAQ